MEKSNTPNWDSDVFNPLQFDSKEKEREYVSVFEYVLDIYKEADLDADRECLYEVKMGDYLKIDFEKSLKKIHSKYSSIIDTPKNIYIQLIKNYKFGRNFSGIDVMSENDLLMHISYYIWKYMSFYVILEENGSIIGRVRQELLEAFKPFLIIEKISIVLNQTTNEVNTKKQPLTFEGLFKDEYKGNLQLFYSRLIANGLIDKNHVWRETTEKNEPAKVYFWLLHKGVFNINKPTPALICFCKEFGITVYRDTEPTPPADVRAVTVKNLLNAETTITPDERKRFVQVFSPFLIK